jgi:TatD DNase family protein
MPPSLELRILLDIIEIKPYYLKEKPSLNMYVDTHAHLDFPEIRPRIGAVLADAKRADVTKIITIGIDAETNANALRISEEHEMVFAAVGWHPHNAEKANSGLEKTIRKQANHPKVVAIGEIGLDYYRNRSPQDIQKNVFSRMLTLATELNFPVVIHCREAFEDTFEIIEERRRQGRIRGVFHCFSGGLEELNRVLKLGFLVSFTGNVTYKNNRLLEVVKAAPIEKLMLETDCPFLTPHPHRGKTNEPAYIPLIAAQIAEIKGLSVEDIARITTTNSHRLFEVGTPPEKAIAYPIRNSLYIALTSRCSNWCRFCPRSTYPVVKGHLISIDEAEEPDFQSVIAAIGDPLEFSEVVFCGFGEPTIRLEVFLQVAKWLRSKGVTKIRLNTNGQANLIHQRNVIPDLVGLIDSVSISINEPNSERYQQMMQSDFGEAAFGAVIAFALGCVGKIPEVILTAVSYPGSDPEAINKIAQDIGAKFRLREFNDLG